jgi:hypothetical protein
LATAISLLQPGATAAMLLLVASIQFPAVAVAAPTTPATPTPALQKLASTLPPPAPRVFLDVASGKDALGRLEFELGAASLLPAHTENVRMLCTGERVGCAYRYLGCFWEAGGAFAAGPRYGYAAELKGRGRNAYGAASALIADDDALAACARAGGAYHGLAVADDATATLLTVPVRGPGRGSTRLRVVRLGAAPPAARAALLRDSAVLGVLAPAGEATLDAMAAAAGGAKAKRPRVVGCGELLPLPFSGGAHADGGGAVHAALCEDGVCRSEVVLAPSIEKPCGPPHLRVDGGGEEGVE